jgi:UDP-N-acetylmuramoyl-tripeptide--D-alanyl-D-alanine ligase
MNIFNFIKNSLFIYQGEDYDYLPLLNFYYSKKIFTSPQNRQKLDWTLKIKSIYYLSLILILVLYLGTNYLVYLNYNLIISFISLIITYFLILAILPSFLITAKLLLFPLEHFLKQKKIKQVKTLIQKHKDHLTIIGVCGSYGKSSVKELISQVLKQKYEVLTTPDNKNTPLGIAEFIDQLSLSTDFLVVEMGEMYKGDIKELCELTQIDYGVITGINEQHLAKFKNQTEIIKTIQEISDYLGETQTLFINETDELVKTTTKTKAKIIPYNLEKIKTIKRLPPLNTISLTYEDQTINSKFLADYYPLMVDLAFKIGKQFNLNSSQIKKALETLHPVPHRMNPIYQADKDFLIIDDSYNGNKTGVLSALETLGTFTDKHKIFLTPGLVDLAQETKKVHQEIAKKAETICDEIWLIKNSSTKHITEEIKQKDKLKYFKTSLEALEESKNLGKNTVLLLQNDWPDYYF